MEITKEQTQIVINRTDKANSYEFGRAGNRFKVFFETPAELDKTIKELKELGLIKEADESYIGAAA